MTRHCARHPFLFLFVFGLLPVITRAQDTGNSYSEPEKVVKSDTIPFILRTDDIIETRDGKKYTGTIIAEGPDRVEFKMSKDHKDVNTFLPVTSIATIT